MYSNGRGYFGTLMRISMMRSSIPKNVLLHSRSIKDGPGPGSGRCIKPCDSCKCPIPEKLETSAQFSPSNLPLASQLMLANKHAIQESIITTKITKSTATELGSALLAEKAEIEKELVVSGVSKIQKLIMEYDDTKKKKKSAGTQFCAA
jgi:hypothetical protein